MHFIGHLYYIASSSFTKSNISDQLKLLGISRGLSAVLFYILYPLYTLSLPLTVIKGDMGG